MESRHWRQHSRNPSHRGMGRSCVSQAERARLGRLRQWRPTWAYPMYRFACNVALSSFPLVPRCCWCSQYSGNGVSVPDDGVLFACALAPIQGWCSCYSGFCSRVGNSSDSGVNISACRRWGSTPTQNNNTHLVWHTFDWVGSISHGQHWFNVFV